MKRICLAVALFPLALLSEDVTDLWDSTANVPHFQEGQIAIQPNMKSSATYRIDKRGIPYLRWYSKPSGATSPMPCIILVSGGAYNNLGDFSQGFYGDWQKKLTALGIQCVDLFYRTPRPDGLPIYQSAWDDGQRAVRVIRSQAAARGIDPNKIGVISMSAGSHMATLLATSSKTNAYEPADEIDQISPRINVALANAIAYGMSDGLTGPNTNSGIGATLDTIFKFDDQTCPMCMTQGGKDEYSPLSSSMVWRKLREKGVATELHIYPDKGHSAYGIERHIEFLRALGWIPALGEAVTPMTRWPDDSARVSVKGEPLYADGTDDLKLEWHNPKVHQTGSVQILLAGPEFVAEADVSNAVVSARRYLNAAGITVVTAQIRSNAAVADTQQAVRAVRAGAASRGLNPDYIGLMGYRADATAAVLASATTEADCKVKWAIAVSPTGLNGAAVLPDTMAAPTLFVHEEDNATDSPLGSVASWEVQRELNVQDAVHTLAGEGDDFIASAAAPGTAAYTYLDRVCDFLSDKKCLATWTGEEEEGEEGGSGEGEGDDGEGDEPEPQIVYTPWFDVAFTNDAFKAGANWIAQSKDPAGGTFTAAEGVESTLEKSEDPAHVEFVAGKEGPIAYDPSTPSKSGKTVLVRGRAKVESRAALPEVDANAKAGLCFIAGMPYGYADGAWSKISSARLAEGSWTDYTAELEFAGEESPRVRYKVGENVGEWVPLRKGSENVLRVRFLGGSFGSFNGTYAESAPERSRGLTIILR